MEGYWINIGLLILLVLMTVRIVFKRGYNKGYQDCLKQYNIYDSDNSISSTYNQSK